MFYQDQQNLFHFVLLHTEPVRTLEIITLGLTFFAMKLAQLLNPFSEFRFISNTTIALTFKLS